jgi:uncharacterized membrane protein YccC
MHSHLSSETTSAARLRTKFLFYIRQMDWPRGFRAGVALCVPLILGNMAGIPNMAWAALGGFMAIAADSSGPSYRTRLSSIMILTLGGTSGFLLGSLVGGKLFWALPAVMLFCFAWNYLPVLGEAFAAAHILVQVLFFSGIGAPSASLHEILARCLLILAGCGWALILALFLWPLDAYRPIRSALSTCYDELAVFLDAVAALSASEAQSASQWHHLSQYHPPRIRRAIEEGWRAVASNRAHGSTETALGSQSVVLLELADMLLARTVALTDHLESVASGGDATCKSRGLTGIEELHSAELWISALMMRRHGQNTAKAEALRQEMARLPDFLAVCMGNADPTSRFFLAQFKGFASLLETAVESAALMRLGKARGLSPAPPFAGSVGHFAYVYDRIGKLREGLDAGRAFDLLAANFNPGSLVLRHAARVGLVCGIDIILSLILHIDHGYWLLMTSLIVLQPHISGTLQRGVQRIGGTVAGGFLAAVLALALHTPLHTAAMIFPLALISMAIRPVSYTVFAFLITPTFILVWLPYSGDWQLAMVRIANTAAGSLIAVAAMIFLFPAYERDRVPQFIRTSIDANRRYLAMLAEAWRSNTPTRSRALRPLASARQASGRAHCDTEESLERLLAESWPGRLPFAQFVTAFVAYLRRFGQSVTALAAIDGEWPWKQSAAVQGRIDMLMRRMEWLEEQIGRGQPTTGDGQTPAKPWPTPEIPDQQSSVPSLPSAENHPGERQLERLEWQTEVLHRELLALRQHGWMPGVPEV